MRDPRTKTRGLALGVGLCAVAIAAGLQVQVANAQDKPAATPASAQAQTNSKAVYYVDFRARTAASYGHAFVWYGRADQKQIEVAGLHPATENVIPYILGHVIPVPSETGKSYGDLDEEYVTASYRVYMTEAEARDVFAFIKRLQARSPMWNAATWNSIDTSGGVHASACSLGASAAYLCRCRRLPRPSPCRDEEQKTRSETGRHRGPQPRLVARRDIDRHGEEPHDGADAKNDERPSRAHRSTH